MDFYEIRERLGKDGKVHIFPDFRVCKTQDLMVRAKSVYAVWDEAAGLWSRDEYDVARLVDQDLWRRAGEIKEETGVWPVVNTMVEYSSGVWTKFKNFVSAISDNYNELDTTLTWADTPVTKEDYVSRRLPYSLKEGEARAYDELMATLYDQEEREKIEWAIGSIVAGESHKIQKFVVFYGDPGSGKSTVMNIIASLFEGYSAVFEARALTGNNQFATAAFQNNPLVAIQHDGDLSRIEDNTKLNSISSHEEIIINEKNKPAYSLRLRAFMFMGTNKLVKITDSRSGLIRRLIDVTPTGDLLTPNRYHTIMGEIPFELGAIASHCLKVYRARGKNFYEGYKPRQMMRGTNIMFDFVDANWETFVTSDAITLKQAYAMYKEFCEESNLKVLVNKQQFREDLKPYFEEYAERAQFAGERHRDIYRGFKDEMLYGRTVEEEKPASLTLDETESLLDAVLAEMPAQYGNENEIPSQKWVNVSTVLKDLETDKLHYVKVPEGHIVIDFDLKDEDGLKSLEKNLKAASKWPATYAELSKGGNGVHLHYRYDGDPNKLSRIYEEGIEIKTFPGDSSLRRRVSRCNNTPISHISGGLPLKEEKPVLNEERFVSEKGLRALIERNLRKEIHPATTPSVDFIAKILDDAYKSGEPYDVTNLRQRVLAFAANSTNQSAKCLKTVLGMKFKSEDDAAEEVSVEPIRPPSDEIIFFDVEVFPNLVVLCYKTRGKDVVTRLINPKSHDIQTLMRNKLVGFNCRRYDNHILYALYLGWPVERVYELSQRIINNSKNAMFREAYDVSYTDIYDFSSVKQSLKKFEIDLGIHHLELGLPWDQPVDKDLWDKVADYCTNDVRATEAVFEARQADWKARLLLSDLSGLSPNQSTLQHTARIIFGSDRDAASKFVYTDLAEGDGKVSFPGYKYDFGKSTYRGEEVGEGGLVRAIPGMYTGRIVCFDVASMHPSSIIALNLFGPYTERFKDLVEARLAIKHDELDKAGTLLDGKLTPYLEDESQRKDLAYALKIIINIVYGLTSAKFENPFFDKRNKDNIVAKRGALFMMDLRHELKERFGVDSLHIKTDSIKVLDPSPEVSEFIIEFGAKYGYTFEIEDIFDRFCLVNDAVYIAREESGTWHAVGAQFAEPYVFKTLFSKEPVTFSDKCVSKSVTTSLHIRKGEDQRFVGRTGLFVPVKNGGELLREKDGNFHAATGTKGYLWEEAEIVQAQPDEYPVDESYFTRLVDEAITTLNKFGDAEAFLG